MLYFHILYSPCIFYNTVGENIIATTKIRNNYGAIQSFIFAIAILVFSLLLLVKLSLLILFASILVSVSYLFSYVFLSKVIALPTIAIAKVVALKSDSDKITVTFR